MMQKEVENEFRSGKRKWVFIMGTFHSCQLKKRTFIMLPDAKQEFLRHHTEFDFEMLSNDKIIFEALKYYIATGRGSTR